MAFSPAIGTLELQTIAKNHEQNSDVDSQSGIDRESESESDLKRDSIEEEKQDVNVLHPSINLPPNEFPLLNSLGVQNESLMNGLLQEVIKYYGSNLGIEFMQRNNQPGFLILCPSSRNTERYTSELVKKNGAIDSILHVISKSTKCSKREAAECVIRGFTKSRRKHLLHLHLRKD
jgi:hypothetical protein